MTYLILRTLHIIGAAVLLGTGIGIAFFTWFGYRLARRNNSIELLRGVLTLTVLADATFTTTAAVVQPVTGAALWHITINDWTHPWLWVVIALYVGVGLCWLPVVVLQIRLRDAASKAASIAALDTKFNHDFKRWFALGVPAFLLVIALVVVMVFRNLFL